MEAEKTSRNLSMCQMAKTLNFLSEPKHRAWKRPDTGIQVQNSQELLFSLSQYFPHTNACSILKLSKKFILLSCCFKQGVSDSQHLSKTLFLESSVILIFCKYFSYLVAKVVQFCWSTVSHCDVLTVSS